MGEEVEGGWGVGSCANIVGDGNNEEEELVVVGEIKVGYKLLISCFCLGWKVMLLIM